MGRIMEIRFAWIAVVYVLLDLLCVALGTGVPIFCILLGVVVGWYVVERCGAAGVAEGEMLRTAVSVGFATSALTFVAMGLVWGPSLGLAFSEGSNLAGLGMPLLLYDAKASFIAWLVLMIVISPLLQVLMTLFGAHLALTARLTRATGDLIHRSV